MARTRNSGGIHISLSIIVKPTVDALDVGQLGAGIRHSADRKHRRTEPRDAPGEHPSLAHGRRTGEHLKR